MGRAKTILGAAQQAVVVEAFAFEVQDRVDHVLEDLRAGDRAILGHVTDQEDWRAARLGQLQKAQGALAQLGNAAREGLDVGGHDRLDRVDHREIGLASADGLDDGVGIGFAQEQQIARMQAHSPRAQADLRY
jgi:hypothetical protein